MDDPNITMIEYIRLEEEKSQRHGGMFNWQTATFKKVEYYENEDDFFTDFENEFPAIVFDNTLTSENALPCEPTVSPLNKNKIYFRISLDESDDEDYTIIFYENSFSYKIIFVNDFKTNSENDNGKNNMPSSRKPTVDYLDDLDFFNDFENEFPAIVYNDYLTSKFDLLVEPPISSQHIDKLETSFSEYDEEEQNALHFGDLFPLDLDDVRRRMTWRQFILALGLHYKEEMAEPGARPSYVHIRDPVRRLCHRMIACSISGRGQGRRRWLTTHFSLISDEGLRGLSVVVNDLPVIDLHKLERLNIYSRYDDTWAWGSLGPERQHVAAASAPAAAEGALIADEDA
uniref:Uncharacterized protein n=1 Tax=Tanacetum cinerariifolium TaxID=118510 RepID=A0A6L2MSU1_TANCI|nr:hypothetical protein [Tanacetum cinerariifolium]